MPIVEVAVGCKSGRLPEPVPVRADPPIDASHVSDSMSAKSGLRKPRTPGLRSFGISGNLPSSFSVITSRAGMDSMHRVRARVASMASFLKPPDWPPARKSGGSPLVWVPRRRDMDEPRIGRIAALE